MTHVSLLKNPLKLLSLFLILKALLVILFIQSGALNLGPDEAQYWTWAKQIDVGYYSKPPGIAWQIYLGIKSFGDTELGVRFFSLIISLVTSFAVYGLSRASSLSKEISFYAGLAWSLIPAGIIGSILATTDGGLVLFWVLACAMIAKSISDQKSLPYISLGLVIAFGALFKCYKS